METNLVQVPSEIVAPVSNSATIVKPKSGKGKKIALIVAAVLVILVVLCAAVIAVVYTLVKNAADQGAFNPTLVPTMTVTPTVDSTNRFEPSQVYTAGDIGLTLQYPAAFSLSSDAKAGTDTMSYTGPYDSNGTGSMYSHSDYMEVKVYKTLSADFLKSVPVVQTGSFAGVAATVHQYAVNDDNYKLYVITNPRTGKTFGVSFMSARALLAPADGGVTGDTADKVAQDYSDYNWNITLVSETVHVTGNGFLPKYLSGYSQWNSLNTAAIGLQIKVPAFFSESNAESGLLANYSGTYDDALQMDYMSVDVVTNIKDSICNDGIGCFTDMNQTKVINGQTYHLYNADDADVTPHTYYAWTYQGQLNAFTLDWSRSGVHGPDSTDLYTRVNDTAAQIATDSAQYQQIINMIQASVLTTQDK